MIHAELFCHNSQVTGFCVRGHAGYSESGSDVVCAGVTTAVQLTANGITECACVPANVEVKENETATFNVKVTGTEPLSYQWQQSTDNGQNWTDIGRATDATYTEEATTTSMNGYQYRCVVSNSAGSVTSEVATLTVNEPAPTTYTITADVTPLGAGTATADKTTATAGDTVKLTATETKIVDLLMRNPGRIFPAEEIYSKIWNESAYSTENTVMVHIRKLRTKIEDDPQNPVFIKTVWGKGYRFGWEERYVPQ